MLPQFVELVRMPVPELMLRYRRYEAFGEFLVHGITVQPRLELY